MRFRSMINAVLSCAPRTPTGKPRRPRCVRPRLEMLEDRTVPSTYTVNALTDNGTGSGLTGDLRYCITSATSGGDTITFGVTGTIKLESALPALNASVAIQGPGASQMTVERDAASTSAFGIFVVGSAASVQISGLTMANGVNNYASGTTGGITNAGTLTVTDSVLSGNTGYVTGGGAIYNTGTLTVSNSTLSANTDFWYGGGAINNTGTLTINNSILSGNADYYGSGGAIANAGTLAINNSTLSGNNVDGSTASTVYGGAIYMGGGKLSLTNSTLANNSAYGGASTYGCTSYGCGGSPAGNGLGGGLYVGGGTVTIDHGTIAGNAATSYGYPYYPNTGGGIDNAAGASALEMHDTILADNSADSGSDLSGGVTSLGYNLIGSSSGGNGFAATDLLNVDPLLGPLQNNGGTTQTMALPADSPAVNAGDPTDNTNANTPAYDQRGSGFPRIFGGQSDIGAFEVQNLSGLAVSGFPKTYTAGATTFNSFTVTARNADGSTNTGYTGTITLTSTDPTAAFFDAATGNSLLSGSSYAYTFVPGDNGTHQFTAVLTRAGTQSITATDIANAAFTGTEWNIAVQPAATSMMIINGSSSVDAEAPSNLSVTLEDRFGNITTNYTGTVKFTTSDVKATIVDPVTGNTVALQGFTYTFTAADAGARSFNVTMNTLGTQSVTAADTANASITASQNIQVVPVTLVVSGFPSLTSAGFGEYVTVTAETASGNTVTGYTGTIVLSSSDAQATIIDPTTGNTVTLGGFTYTFSPYDYGTASFWATLNTAGKNQSITATDTALPSANGSQTGIEVDPAVTVSGPSYSYINQPLAFTLGTFGDPAGTNFTYLINWGDGSPTQTVSGPSGTQVTHAYSAAGNRYVTVTATDPGGLSGTASASVDTLAITVVIQTDPAQTSQQMLVITDSTSYYNIALSSSAANNSVTLWLGSTYILGAIAPTNGNAFALVMVLDTGYGDTIDARNLAISSVLVGGTGSTTLYGGSARNLLIAGTGNAWLNAGSAGDILIGGYSTYDTNTTALAYIMAEWDSSASYSTRLSKISKGGGLNGSYMLNGTTVFDNGVTDYLYGSAGPDWFFAHIKGKRNLDKIYAKTGGETVTNI